VIAEKGGILLIKPLNNSRVLFGKKLNFSTNNFSLTGPALTPLKEVVTFFLTLLVATKKLYLFSENISVALTSIGLNKHGMSIAKTVTIYTILVKNILVETYLNNTNLKLKPLEESINF